MKCEFPEGQGLVLPTLEYDDELWVVDHEFPLVVVLLYLPGRLYQVSVFDGEFSFEIEGDRIRTVLWFFDGDELAVVGGCPVVGDHTLDGHLLSIVSLE